MPNWCSNTLYVSGKEEELKRFVEACKGKTPAYYVPENMRDIYGLQEGQTHVEPVEKEFTFNALVPVPKSIESLGYSDGGYYWQIDNWGAKWDASEPEIHWMAEEELEISFETAWSPAIEWVERASKLFPELEFKLLYSELGLCFAGEVAFVGGNKVRNIEHDDDEGVREFMSSDLGYEEDHLDELMGV